MVFAVFSLKKKKYLAFFISFFIFSSFLMKTTNFQFANSMGYLMLIPIICFVLILSNFKNYKNELSILVIFTAYNMGEFFKIVLLL
ncbi:hypothetical protein DIT68_13215 [Brumimicrobium oceani]|uniref:Uncharacterized protein n=1 Tax=Brumimicrobium oceani TaxID=2100725 RepID=A0A2U2XA50_9FLAO|nr:hypothetical protein DIT68_13215 [Brumimicrobium oceani]